MSKGNKDTRTRNWTIVIYPDSAPTNWRELLDEWHIEWVESPLHDKDLNPNGEPKKPHIHVLLMFGSVKAYEQVLELIQPLNCPIPIKVHNSKSLVRYMAHLDNPEKAQYDIKAIVAHGGVDVSDLLKPSSSEVYDVIRDMIIWCDANNVIEFQDLFEYSIANHYDDWFPLLCDRCSFVLSTYFKSKRHRTTPKAFSFVEDSEVIDTETGEIIKKAKEH